MIDRSKSFSSQKKIVDSIAKRKSFQKSQNQLEHAE